MTADDELMEMLFGSYIVVAETGTDGKALATCVACNIGGQQTFRWNVCADVEGIYSLAVAHIRDRHQAVAVLTIDAMRHTIRAEVNVQHRLERLRLGVMVLRDQLAEVTRQDVVLKPVATHGRVLALATTAKVLLATDRLLASGDPLPVQVRLERKAADVG